MAAQGWVVIDGVLQLSGLATTGQIKLSVGTALLPSIAFTVDPSSGFNAVPGTTAVPGVVVTGVQSYGFFSQVLQAKSVGVFGWAASSINTVTDTGISRLSAGSIGFGTGAQGSVAASVQAAAFDTTAGGFLSSGGQFKIGNGGASGLGVFTNNAISFGSTIKVDALPTIASGFGTSPSITAGSTPFSGSVNVGTGGTANSGVINFGGTAFPSAPFCIVTPSNATGGAMNAFTSTTQLNMSSNTAWPASTIVNWICVGAK